jgi:adenosylcobinamide-GDP ribazoletransferase
VSSRRGLRQAVGFLSVVGGAEPPGPAALGWFPVAGAAIGAAVGGVWWAAEQVWPRAVAAALATLADLVLTGMLHLDGLCDTADGLLPPLPRERRLEVMRAPDVGAFGVGAAVVVVLLRWAAFSSLAAAPLLVAGLWAASRTLMAGVVTAVPYVRRDGLATAFGGGAGHRGRFPCLTVGGAVLGAGLAAAWRLPAGPVAVGAALVAGAAVVWFAWRRLGGYSGDVLGAAGIVGETVGLLVAAARW